MKLIMAISKDGWLSRKAEDDMSWLGQNDKAIFRVLTMCGTEPLGVGRSSALLMPLPLPGRKTATLTRKPVDGTNECTLEEFSYWHPNGWLLGGRTVAHAAFDEDLINEVHLCKSERYAFPLEDQGAIPDDISLRVIRLGFRKVLTTKLGDVTVESWRK